MNNSNKRIGLLQNINYTIKFTYFLIKNKWKRLRDDFLLFRDDLVVKKEIKKNLSVTIPEVKKEKKSFSKIIKIKKKSKNSLKFPLLVLFDAENMPIQDYYKSVRSTIIKEFGQKSWESATLETAYKESTEYYNNKGYNQSINTHYVGYGKDKADDKLVEIAQSYKIPHVIIISNDKELIARLQEVTARATSGKLFVYNGTFFKEYTLSEDALKQSNLKRLEERRDKLFLEYMNIKQEIAILEEEIGVVSISKPAASKENPLKNSINNNKKIKTQESKVTLPTIDDLPHLKEAILDEHIKKDFLVNPLFENFTETFKQVSATNSYRAKQEAHQVFEAFKKQPRIKHLLETKGLDISVFKIALRYRIENFEIADYDFSSFVQFIEYVVQGSDIKLVLKNSSQYRLFFKDTPINELLMQEVIPKNNYGLKEGILEEKFSASFNQEFFKALKEKM